MRRIERKSSKKMSFKYRCDSISTKDKLKMLNLASFLKRSIVIASRVHQVDPTSPVLNQIIGLIVTAFGSYWDYRYAMVPARTRTFWLPRNINSFPDNECWERFRLRKEDLQRLHVLLRLPANVRIELY